MKTNSNFFVSKKNFKDYSKPAHWVDYSKLISLEWDDFIKRTQKFDEKEAGVTGKTENKKNTAKNTKTYAHTNAEDNEVIHKDK